MSKLCYHSVCLLPDCGSWDFPKTLSRWLPWYSSKVFDYLYCHFYHCGVPREHRNTLLSQSVARKRWWGSWIFFPMKLNFQSGIIIMINKEFHPSTRKLSVPVQNMPPQSGFIHAAHDLLPVLLLCSELGWLGQPCWIPWEKEMTELVLWNVSGVMRARRGYDIRAKKMVT